MKFEPITDKIEKEMKYASVRSAIRLKNGIVLLSSNSKDYEVNFCSDIRVVLNPDWLKESKSNPKWVSVTIKDDEIEAIEEFSAMNPIESISESPDGVGITLRTEFQDASQNKIYVCYEKNRKCFWSPNRIKHLRDIKGAIDPNLIEQLDKQLMHFRAHFDKKHEVIASKPGIEFTSANLATFIEAVVYGQLYCSKLEMQELKKAMKAMASSKTVLHSSEESLNNDKNNN